MVIEKNWKCDKLLSTTEQSENKKQKKDFRINKRFVIKTFKWRTCDLF